MSKTIKLVNRLRALAEQGYTQTQASLLTAEQHSNINRLAGLYHIPFKTSHITGGNPFMLAGAERRQAAFHAVHGRYDAPGRVCVKEAV